MKSRRLFLHVLSWMVVGLFLASFAWAMAGGQDVSVLMTCYVRYLVAQQIGSQTTAIADDAPPGDRPQIEAAAGKWSSAQMDVIRESLDAQFGPDAKSQFENFFAEYSAAEQKQDPDMLRQIAFAMQMVPAPSSYTDLKKRVVEDSLGTTISGGSRWLSEIQTWADLRRREPATPPLDSWLGRNDDAPAALPPPPRTEVISKPSRPLDDAEADFEEFEGEDDSEFSPLDSFDDMRSERRKKALEEAEAGMKQIADERKAAEEEYAAKKLAAAQAEAENMKRQAEKLAAVEKEALEQREKSWGNRLKSIVGATLSAGIGAFTGGVGARAGEEAVNAIFKD